MAILKSLGESSLSSNYGDTLGLELIYFLVSISNSWIKSGLSSWGSCIDNELWCVPKSYCKELITSFYASFNIISEGSISDIYWSSYWFSILGLEVLPNEMVRINPSSSSPEYLRSSFVTKFSLSTYTGFILKSKWY